MGGLTVAERLDALARAVVAGRDVLPRDVVVAAAAVEDRAGHRMRLSADHTVVAFAGATGSGKSSLVNAVTGVDVAAVDVLRPTTSEALALVRGEEGSAALLDWLGVRRRHVLEVEPTPDGPADAAWFARNRRPVDEGGLVLLDLPDHDSVVVEHRLEAERLVALVDLMVWVVDPQKYADAALHDRYLRNLTGHRDVLLVALNQIDRLPPAQRDACAADLARLLADDGLAGVPVLLTSARTGEGVEALRDRLDDAARRREAATARTVADVREVAERIRAVTAPTTSAPPQARRDLVVALERAGGVPLVTAAVRAGWAARGRRATGWPPTRWLARFRPDPLRRLHLGRTGGRADEADPDAEVVRSSLPAPGPAEEAKARGAVRAYVDQVTQGAPDPWVLHARTAPDHDGLPDALDHAVASTPVLPARRPGWWAAVGALQWLLLAVLVGGALWLGALAVLASLQLPAPEPPRWGDVPWPTVALLGGALAGLLVALVARVAVGVGARRQAARATARLHEAVALVADRRVVEPVREVLDRMAACHAEATTAAAEPGRRGRSR
ncbi:GTPase [Actinotalea sp. Marseille-Q4924]|uniref:GTPase n=1 Tax=Actinotalea sp. Marseille-Q4924 TaxID=2866571 RepID=UPI001CE487E4|nr:GTPase [Actinotalea sp. Marseille-Q4924]